MAPVAQQLDLQMQTNSRHFFLMQQSTSVIGISLITVQEMIIYRERTQMAQARWRVPVISSRVHNLYIY